VTPETPEGPATGRPVTRVWGLSSARELRWKLDELEEILLVVEMGDGAAGAPLSGNAKVFCWTGRGCG